ncbi:MAG: hypothetical protein KatS3mg059_0248 [Thermomicrobiales bacterium]|nr:MAG: hypothetical protein KatS3mg059_0248 [Thermomicrobiales bacterium]
MELQELSRQVSVHQGWVRCKRHPSVAMRALSAGTFSGEPSTIVHWCRGRRNGPCRAKCMLPMTIVITSRQTPAAAPGRCA